MLIVSHNIFLALATTIGRANRFPQGFGDPSAPLPHGRGDVDRPRSRTCAEVHLRPQEEGEAGKRSKQVSPAEPGALWI